MSANPPNPPQLAFNACRWQLLVSGMLLKAIEHFMVYAARCNFRANGKTAFSYRSPDAGIWNWIRGPHWLAVVPFRGKRCRGGYFCVLERCEMRRSRTGQSGSRRRRGLDRRWSDVWSKRCFEFGCSGWGPLSIPCTFCRDRSFTPKWSRHGRYHRHRSRDGFQQGLPLRVQISVSGDRYRSRRRHGSRRSN